MPTTAARSVPQLIDFRKVFYRVWHAGLWQVLRSFNIEEDLVQAIQVLYEKSRSAVLLNSQLGGLFKTTVGVHQRCLPILFNLFLERIMQETLHDHHTSIFTGRRSICNLRVANNINLRGAAMMNFKTSPTEQWYIEWKSTRKRARS